MKNLTRNTAAVWVVTLFTGLAVFSAIQLGGRLFGTSSANAQTMSAPASQAQNDDAYGYDQSTDDYDHDESSDGYGQSSGSQGSSDPYGQGGSSAGSTGRTTMTCPATGCSASSCHALQ